MAFSRTLLMAAAALAALGACTTTGPAQDAASQVAAPSPAGTLDAAIAAAGGAEALGKVQEVYFTGVAKVTVDGKTTEQNTAVVVRPFNFYRVSTWAKGAEAKTSKTIQAEQKKAWDVTRVTWQPMPEAGAKFENEQLGLFSLMLLAPLKADGVSVTARSAGVLEVKHPEAQPAELTFDASGKLVSAAYTGTDAKTGASVKEVATFSGEIVSNGVKWPKTITIARDGATWYELEIASLEVLAEKKVRPLEQSMQYEQGGPPTIEDAG